MKKLFYIRKKSNYNLVNYILFAIILIAFIITLRLVFIHLLLLWTMRVQSKGVDIATYNGKPLQAEIIVDIDRLSESKLAFDRVLTLTLNQKPDILIFYGKTGENGKSQKKIESLIYIMDRFNVTPEKIFVVPDRSFYEYLLGSTNYLVYYVDFMKSLGVETAFEGYEHVADSITFVMASSVDRLEFLKDTLKGYVVIIADENGRMENAFYPDILITQNKWFDKKSLKILPAQKGILFLNLY